MSARRAGEDAAADVDRDADGAPGSPAAAAWAGRRGADSERAAGGRRTDFVQSLDRGLAVIRCFSSEHPSLTLSEVA